MTLKQESAFYLLSRAFSAVVAAAVLFGIKGLIILLYSQSNTLHVYTMDIALMWSLAMSAGLFFACMSILVVMDSDTYNISENINAFLVVVSAILIFSFIVMVECTTPDSQQCKFLYPVSKIRLAEAVANVVMVFVYFIIVFSFALSVEFNRKQVIPMFAWGGIMFVVLIVLFFNLPQWIGALSSCQNDTLLHEKVSLNTNVTLLVITILSIVFYSLPHGLFYITESKTLKVADLQDIKGRFLASKENKKLFGISWELIVKLGFLLGITGIIVVLVMSVANGILKMRYVCI